MEPLPARLEPDPSPSRSSPQQTPAGPRMDPSPLHSLKSTHTSTHVSPHSSVPPSPEFSSPRPAFENRGSLDTLAAAALKPLSDPFRQSQDQGQGQNQSQGQSQSDNKQRHSPPLPSHQGSVSPAKAQNPSHSRQTHSSFSNHHHHHHHHGPSSSQSRPLDFATIDSKSTQSRSRSTSPPANSRLDPDQRSTHKVLPSFQELSNGRGGDSSVGRHHYRDRSYQASDDESERLSSVNPRSGDHPSPMRCPRQLASAVVSQHPPNQDKACNSNARSTMSISSLLGDSSSTTINSRPEESRVALDSCSRESLQTYAAAKKKSKQSMPMEQDGVDHDEYEISNGYSLEGQEEQRKRAQLHRHSRHHAPDATPEIAPDMRDAAYRKYYYQEQREKGRKEAVQKHEEQTVEEQETTRDLDREKSEDSMQSERTAHSERHQHRHRHHHHGHGPLHLTPLAPAPPHIHAHGHHHHHVQSHMIHQHQHQHRFKYGPPQHHHYHQHHHHKHTAGAPPTGTTSAFSYVPKALGLSLSPRLKVNATQVYISYLIQLDQMQRAQHLMRSSEKRKSVPEPAGSLLENGAPPLKQHQGAHIRSMSLSDTSKPAQVVPRGEIIGHGNNAMSPVSDATADPALRRSRSVESPDMAVDNSEIGDRRSNSVSQLPESEPPSPYIQGRAHSYPHGHPAHVHALAHHHHHHPHLHPYPHMHGYGHIHAHPHAHAHLHPHSHPHAHAHTHAHPHTAPVLPAHVHPALHHHHIVPTKSEKGSPVSPARGSTSPIVHRLHGVHHLHPHHHPYHPNHPNHQHHFHHHTHPSTPNTHGQSRGHAHSHAHGHSHSHSHSHGRHTHSHSHGSSPQLHASGHAPRSHSALPEERGRDQSQTVDDTSMSPPLRPVDPEGSPVVEVARGVTTNRASPGSPLIEQGSPHISSPHNNSHNPSRDQGAGTTISAQSPPLDSRPDVNDN